MNSVFVNFLKIDCPIGRLKFFKYTFCLAFLQVVLSLIFMLLAEKVFSGELLFASSIIFTVFIMFPILYLYFVQYSKRLWDITKSNNVGILAGIITIIISIVCTIIFPVLTLGIYLILILLPGKMITND